MRILIVEDEVKIRTGMSNLISSHTSHTIIGEARNGKEGLEMIFRLRPELVISDIRMPVMDGLEMLKEVHLSNINCHFIILSGYSEFEYAQQALRYGVDDYLLKPLAPEDVTHVLDKVQCRIEQEERLSAETTEGLIRDILLGSKSDTSIYYKKLALSEVFFPDIPFFLVAGYIGNTSSQYLLYLEKMWENMRKSYPDFRIFHTTLDHTQEMFCLIQAPLNEQELESKITRRVYMNLSKYDMPVWTLSSVKDLSNLGNTGEKLRDLYLYGMRFGYRMILTEEKINALELEEFQYPKHMENALQISICGTSTERLKTHANEFLDYIKNMKCDPKYIRKSYEKALAFMENICHETNPDAYKKMQIHDLSKAASNGITTGELDGYFQKGIQIILSSKDKKEDIRNYTIRRAITFIREHYKENISLELLSDHLEITPEYLSTLFNKEVGINFSTFLKRFRISQAKRLLKGTDQKIYAIASQVGYNDPKYFNRVFKEETGMSPGDYRQTN